MSESSVLQGFNVCVTDRQTDRLLTGAHKKDKENIEDEVWKIKGVKTCLCL